MLKLANNLELPLDFMTERISFLARTGAGKSGGMRVFAEQIFDAHQFFIFVDPKGDAWGIRAAGTGKGRPVLIMGGDHADIPLSPDSGKVAAEFLVKERVSTIVDISDFSTQKMWKFMADFTQTLYKLNRDVMHLFIDEIDMIAGQQYFDPHCLHGIQMIQNKGRGRGFGLTIATQRPQIVNKTILNASGTYIVMQTLGDDALKVVKSCLAQTASKETTQEILRQIPTFQPREAFVYSPQTLGLAPRRITFASFATFDSMRTPKPGEVRQTPKSIADIDLAAVQRDMAATIEKAVAEDPANLKRQIIDLKKQLDSKLKAAPVVPAAAPLPPKEVPVVKDSQLKQAESIIGTLDGLLIKLDGKLQDLRIIRDDFKDGVDKVVKAKNAPDFSPANMFKAPAPAATKPAPKAVPQIHRQNMTENMTNGDGLKLAAKQQTMLDTLLTFEALGRQSVERSIIATFAGMSAKGGGFRNYVSAMRASGLVDYESGERLSLTDDGRALARSTVVINSVSDLHNAWKAQIKAQKQIQMIDLVIAHHPSPVSRDMLAEVTDMSTGGGGFRNYVSALKSLGIIDYTNIKGSDNDTVPGVRATDLLFPEGLY